VKRQPHYLHVMPRIDRDIDDCLAFIGRQLWGKPNDRRSDIRRGIERVLTHPEANHAELWRASSGIWLRRCKAAQFVIVYGYLPPKESFPVGVVSIRAVRHSRVKDVFAGVKEPTIPYPPSPA
jgi:hypothetical protein